MIKNVIIESNHPGIPFADLLEGLEIPLANPICPIQNHRFNWDEESGKTHRNITIHVNTNELLEVVRKKCKKKYKKIKSHDLGQTLVLQSHHCRLSK
ncbi:MAG: hypothetical protein Q8K30_06440 [Candidatus Gracilibacteria bacterium]|nr:hypothetical protein [Candidatus Gracilibacteria bacterium]MDP2396666.1 hypothetical protein [bacterium]MDP3380749.1 hypothetical protein [bacterium]